MNKLLTLIALCALIPNSSFAAAKTREDLATSAPKDSQSSRLSLSVLGWVEESIVYPGGINFSAKLDTGAKTSSIDAMNIERFKDLDGQEWVRFTLQNSKGKKQTLEKPVLKWVRIKQKGGGFVQRPVVDMALCLGTHYIEGKMNLAKRDNFIYQVLVGRNMLSNNIIVDSGMRHTSKPSCEAKTND